MQASDTSQRVNEVQWINALNAEEVQEQLQARLGEIEQRFKAAADRRQERLESISGKQKRYHSHKSQQMSSMRLRIEMERMERWQRLQAKIEAVQKRREQRLLEIQRRSSVIEPLVDAESELRIESADKIDTEDSRDGDDVVEVNHNGHSKKRKSKKRSGGYFLHLRHAIERISAGKSSAIAAVASVVKATLQKKVVYRIF